MCPLTTTTETKTTMAHLLVVSYSSSLGLQDATTTPSSMRFLTRSRIVISNGLNRRAKSSINWNVYSTTFGLLCLLLPLVSVQLYLSVRIVTCASSGSTPTTTTTTATERKDCSDTTILQTVETSRSTPLSIHTNQNNTLTVKQQQQTRRYHFPQWGDTDQSDGPGIDLSVLLDFVHGVLNGTANVVPINKARKFEFPPTLYVVDLTTDGAGVYVSKRIRDRTEKSNLRNRVQPQERIYQRAYQKLKQQEQPPPETIPRWSNLQRFLQSNNNNNNNNHHPSFPFVVWYGDWRWCHYKIWNKQHSLPIFTTCAKVENCHYAFPIPTYKTISDSQERPEDWQPIFGRYRQDYPFAQKKRQIVWRGSLSGALHNYTSPRARIGTFAAAHRDSPLFDIGISRVPQHLHKLSDLNMTALGGLVPSITPMQDFQTYLAILDIDGNSWSSRFGSLLCFNSVIVKVEPKFVDYFQQDLVPWYHYIPVRYDLSDLKQVAEYIVDPNNEKTIQQIIDNANEWCRNRMVLSSIVDDVLDIWDAYIGFLDQHSSLWMDHWKQESKKILDNPDFAMVKL